MFQFAYFENGFGSLFVFIIIELLICNGIELVQVF